MAKITLTRALTEMKLLDARIEKAIKEQVFVALSKGTKEPVIVGSARFKDVAAAQAGIKADFDSLNSLIERRAKISEALAKANIEVQVIINGRSMSLRSAIDMKQTLGYKRKMLDGMVKQRATALTNIETNRNALDKKINELVVQTTQTSQNTQLNADVVASVMETVRSAQVSLNDLALVDPLKLDVEIDKLRAEIEAVEGEIDFILSEANATNHIEA